MTPTTAVLAARRVRADGVDPWETYFEGDAPIRRRLVRRNEEGAKVKAPAVPSVSRARSLAAQAQEPQQPTFRSARMLSPWTCSVFDGQRAIPGLTAADFDVRDNGVRQTLAGVRPNTLPIDVRLLFDTSGSINAEDLERYRRAMARVAEALRREDRVEILTFSGRISEVVPLQHPPITVITQRQDRDGTSFFDAVSLAMVTRPMPRTPADHDRPHRRAGQRQLLRQGHAV